MRDVVTPHDVECVDANRFLKVHPVRGLAGWPLKPYAIIHSPFREVLALDADSYPVRNPEYLFSYPEYQQKGAIFWPDLGRTEKERAIWEVMGIPFREEPEFESGQMIVDKSQCWEPLRLAMWMNEKAAFFYRIIHGDKDTFRFGWHRYGRPFAMTKVPVQVLSVRGGPCCSGVMCQHDLDGFRIFQHRNIYKWRLHQHNPRIAGFLFEGECREFLAELRTLWDGRIGRNPGRRQFRGPLASALMGQIWLVSGLASPLPNQNGSPSPIPEGARKPRDAANEEAPPEASARHEWIFKEDGRIQGSEESQLIYWAPGKGYRQIEIGDGSRTHLVLTHREGAKWKGAFKSARGTWSILLEPLKEVFPALGDDVNGNGASQARRARRRTLHLFNSAKGIGDHVTGLYACAGIANSGYEVVYHTRFPEWFVRVAHPHVTIKGNPPPMVDGTIRRQSGAGRVLDLPVDLNSDYSVQVRHAPDNARWYSAAASSVTGGHIAQPCRPQRINTTIECRPFDFSRYVLLFPFVSWRGREWPLMHWTRLAHFLIEENFHVVAVGLEEDAARMHEAFTSTYAMWVTGQEAEWVMDAMLGATMVIGMDSGMVHVAGLLGLPAICIHAHLPPKYLFSCAPSIRSVSPETNCVFCRWRQEGGYTSACDTGCSALATVAPEKVAGLALRLIANRSDKGESSSRNASSAILTRN